MNRSFNNSFIFNSESVKSLNFHNSTVRNYKSKIIIADDNQILLNSVQNLLNKIILDFNLDFEIVLCNDGLEILENIIIYNKISNVIKLIITDENMDYLNGSEAVKYVRKLEQKKNTNNIHVISMTCFEDGKVLKNIKKAGSDLILIKPISRKQILKVFDNLVIIKNIRENK